jgi:nucleotide-binding universal stress UspA family protein
VLAGPAARHPEVEVRPVVECAPTAGSLAQQSVGASLLVVGTRGHRELSGFVLGSVSQAMMRRSACPVAVVAHTHTGAGATSRDDRHATA